MAFQKHCLPLWEVLACVELFSLVVSVDARFRGFGKFNVVHGSNQGAVFEELWFTQKLDHFNSADSREWKQVSLTCFGLK